jgi:hypothetical protein
MVVATLLQGTAEFVTAETPFGDGASGRVGDGAMK